jgi:predicted solute-binding protein
MIPATVLLGSMAAGGLGLYLSGSTGASTSIAKPVEQSIANEVSRPTQDVSPEEEPEITAPEVPEVAKPVPVAEPLPEVPQKTPEPEPEVAKPVPEPEPVPVAEVPQKTPEPEPEPVPVSEVPESPEEEPTAVQGGQRGGFGRPTWAPVNAGTSLTQALGIVPGTPAGNALATATGSKTPQQIQLELVAIDEQIRALNASTFSLTQEEKEADDALAASRKELQDLEDEIFRNEKLLTFLTGKINSTSNIQETNVKLTKLVVDEVTPIFNGPPDNLQLGGRKKGKPGKPGGTGAFTPTENQKLWLVKALRYYRNLPDEDRDEDIPDLFRVENKKDLDRDVDRSSKIPNYTSDDTLKSSDAFDLTKVATDDLEKALALKWWNFLRGKVHQEEIDPTKVQAELTVFMNEKRKYDNLVRESQYKIPDAKEKTKENETELQEIRTKLSENKKKKKELEASRELLLKELSAYKVPQSFFDKKEVKPSVLPTGEVLNKLLIEFRQIEDEIARNERERNDYVSIQLASNPSWTRDDRYTELTESEKALKKKKSNKIAEIEGRAPSQLEQLKENPFEVFARELIKDKLTKQAGEVLLKTSFPQVFKMYYELSKSSADKIYEQVDKYYNFFKKGVSSSINLTSFNGQDVSRALAFFFALTKEQRLTPELKQKVTQFSQENKQIIANALVNLELALQQIKTPTTEERSIVEQALMSGDSVPWKTIKRAAVSLDVSNLFTKTVEQKLIILKDSFRERIYDKLKDVSVKYGLWGKTEIQGYRQTIEASFDEYKKLLLAEIATFNAILDTDRQKIEKQNQSMTKIRGLARLMMTLLQQGDKLRQFLESILDSPEFKGGAKLTISKFKETLIKISGRLQGNNQIHSFVLDGKQALFDQLVQAKSMILKKNINLKNLVDRYRKLGRDETLQNIFEKLAAAKELLQAYDDLATVFASRERTASKVGSLASSTASKVGSLAAYLFSGKVSVDDIKTALKNIGAFFSRFSWSSKITARPLPEDPKLSPMDKETLQDLVDAFSSLPPDIDSYENLPKSDLSSIFKTLVNSGRLVGSLEALNPNIVDFKQQYEVLLDLIEEYADQERIPLTGGANAMEKEIRKRRKQAREQLRKEIKEKQEKEDARLMSNYKRYQYRSDVNEVRKRSDYREKQLRGDIPFDEEEKQEQLLEEGQEQTNSSGTPIGTLLEQLKRVLTLASTVAESQGISLSDNTFKPAVREEQKPSFDDEEEEDLTKPVLTGVPTDTTVTLSWTAKQM